MHVSLTRQFNSSRLSLQRPPATLLLLLHQTQRSRHRISLSCRSAPTRLPQPPPHPCAWWCSLAQLVIRRRRDADSEGAGQGTASRVWCRWGEAMSCGLCYGRRQGVGTLPRLARANPEGDRESGAGEAVAYLKFCTSRRSIIPPTCGERPPPVPPRGIVRFKPGVSREASVVHAYTGSSTSQHGVHEGRKEPAHRVRVRESSSRGPMCDSRRGHAQSPPTVPSTDRAVSLIPPHA